MRRLGAAHPGQHQPLCCCAGAPAALTLVLQCFIAMHQPHEVSQACVPSAQAQEEQILLIKHMVLAVNQMSRAVRHGPWPRCCSRSAAAVLAGGGATAQPWLTEQGRILSCALGICSQWSQQHHQSNGYRLKAAGIKQANIWVAGGSAGTAAVARTPAAARGVG